MAKGMLTIAIVLALALASAGEASARPQPPRTPPGFFGVNASQVVGLPDRQRDAQLEAIRDSGIEVVRTDAAWAVVEKQPPDFSTHRHTYSWAHYDGWVRALSEHGLRWLPIVDYSAPWAASIPGNAFSPPRDQAEYAAFARALADRYGAGGGFWKEHPDLRPLPPRIYEIWNEENGGYWHPAPNAEQYADLFMAARNAIKSVDPSSKIAVGGLSNRTDVGNYIARILAHRPETRSAIDLLGYHIYDNNLTGLIAELVRIRLTLIELGLPPLQIALTETGWTTSGDPQAPGLKPIDETRRAANYRGFTNVIARTDCGVAMVAPHTWWDRESDPSAAREWYGIADHSGKLKPSASAYSRELKRFRGLAGPAAPWVTVHLCQQPAPDSDGDGAVDERDYYPVDPTRNKRPRRASVRVKRGAGNARRSRRATGERR